MKRWDWSLEGTTCTVCHGKGEAYECEDAHRSAGTIPCPAGYFRGHGYPTCYKGKLRFSDYDRENQDELMKTYPDKPEPVPPRKKAGLDFWLEKVL